MGNTLGSVGHSVTVATVPTATQDKSSHRQRINWRGCVPIKLYLQISYHFHVSLNMVLQIFFLTITKAIKIIPSSQAVQNL